MTSSGADTRDRMRQVGTRFGSHVVHEGLDLQVRRGEILGLAGGSGSGKSVLLREMIGLQRPSSGRSSARQRRSPRWTRRRPWRCAGAGA